MNEEEKEVGAHDLVAVGVPKKPPPMVRQRSCTSSQRRLAVVAMSVNEINLSAARLSISKDDFSDTEEAADTTESERPTETTGEDAEPLLLKQGGRAMDISIVSTAGCVYRLSSLYMQ